MMCNAINKYSLYQTLLSGILGLGLLAFGQDASATGKARYRADKNPNFTFVDRADDAYRHSFLVGFWDKIVIRPSTLTHRGGVLGDDLELSFHIEACVGGLGRDPLENPNCLTWSQRRPLRLAKTNGSDEAMELSADSIEIPLAQLFDRLPRNGSYPDIGFYFYVDVVRKDADVLNELKYRLLRLSELETGGLLFNRPYRVKTNLAANQGLDELPDVLEYTVEFNRGEDSGTPITLEVRPSLPSVPQLLEELIENLELKQRKLGEEFSRRSRERTEGNFLVLPGIVGDIIDGIDTATDQSALSKQIEEFREILALVKESDQGSVGPAMAKLVEEINRRFPAKSKIPNESRQVMKLVAEAVQTGLIAQPTWVQLDAFGPPRYIGGRAELVRWVADRL